MAKREYKDSEGNVVTLYKLVQIEPEWAVSVIRWYEGKLDSSTSQLHLAVKQRDDLQRRVKSLEIEVHQERRVRDIELEARRVAESRLDSAENAMREVVSHLQHSQRGSTHWAGCSDVHPICQAIDMLMDALSVTRHRETEP